MCMDCFTKKESMRKKSSGFEKFIKIVTVIGSIAAIATLLYIAYQKFNEYMRNLCESNLDDYLDDCSCDGTDCENCEDFHGICDDEKCPCHEDDEPEIEVELADESDFEENNTPENE